MTAPLLIRRAHLIIGDGTEIDEADLLIMNGRISAVSADPLDRPDAQVIDADGKTLMPGLIDAHLHFDFLGVGNIVAGHLRRRRHAATLKELLHNGVTAVRTMADPLGQIQALQKRVASSRLPGPRMVVAGPALTAPGGHPEITVCRDNPWLQKHMVRQIEDEDQARTVVSALHADGVDLIKIVFQGGEYAEFGDNLNKLSVDAVRAVLEHAHRLGLKVSAHTHYQDDVELLLGLGVDSIEHGVIEEPITDDGFLSRWADSEVPLVSTLTIAQLVRDGSGTQYLQTAGDNLLRAHQAGVRIVAGTDSMVGAMSADSLHQELRLMVDAGLPASAAIAAATGHAADLLDLTDRGRITEGARADLLLLNDNPLDNIDATTDLAMVIQDGRVVHEIAPSTRVELINFRVPDEPVQHFRDTTGGSFDNEVLIEVDHSRFADDGLRTIRYTDPGSATVLRIDTLRSDPTLLTQEWTCRIPADNTDLTAQLVGRRVELSGIFEGAEVSRDYSVRGGRWMQGMLFDAATFIGSTGTTLDLMAIGTTGRGALEASEFELTKDEKPTGTEIRATLVMPRWRRFWAAQASFDATTGELIRYLIKGKQAAILERT